MSCSLNRLSDRRIAFQGSRTERTVHFIIACNLRYFAGSGARRGVPLVCTSNHRDRFVYLRHCRTSGGLQNFLRGLTDTAICLARNRDFFALSIVGGTDNRVRPFGVYVTVFQRGHMLQVRIADTFFMQLNRNSPKIQIGGGKFDVFGITTSARTGPGNRYPGRIQGQRTGWGPAIRGQQVPLRRKFSTIRGA